MDSLLQKNRTLIMGIINVSPDSFSGDGIGNNLIHVVKLARSMCTDGADSIDIGGESTRPGATPISTTDELDRVIPAISLVRKEIGTAIVISVDTYKSEVAKQALLHGANIINSLGGMTRDPEMATVLAASRSPVVLYHVKGTPGTMQQGTISYQDVVEDVKSFFTQQITYGISRGMKREQFLLDPGIGFGKTVDQNLEILRRFKEFQSFDLPLAVGVSRKSHIGTVLTESLGLLEVPGPLQRIEGALAETAIAVMNGAKLVRTHDVKETKRFLTVLDAVTSQDV